MPLRNGIAALNAGLGKPMRRARKASAAPVAYDREVACA